MLVRLLAICFWPILAFAAPISFNVECNGTQVGTVNIDVSASGAGVQGTFTSVFGGPPPTLAAAAAHCGEHHFNWFQIVVADNFPPNDAGGNPLTLP
ncbi:MAG: hypothetical protein FJW20_22960 [Acidimicrobiia bacterium]|nr:hypothetical protein [Acidimicrobiia bacterium]